MLTAIIEYAGMHRIDAAGKIPPLCFVENKAITFRLVCEEKPRSQKRDLGHPLNIVRRFFLLGWLRF